MAYVYLHTRLDRNEPFYVGIGEDNYKNKNYYRSRTKLSRNKYWKLVVENTPYKIDILYDNLSKKEAKAKEIELIKFYGRADLGKGPLCNLSNGGEGSSKKGEYFKKVVQKTLAGKAVKIWESKVVVHKELGFNSANLTRSCNSGGAAFGYKWEHFNPNKKYEIEEGEVYDKKIYSNRRIVQKTKQGNVLKIWESISEIEKSTNFVRSCIYKSCTGLKNSAYGYKWEYLDWNKDYKVEDLGIDFTKKLIPYKKVVQKSINGDILKIWDCVKSVEKDGIPKNAVYNALSARNIKMGWNKAHGFKWEWA